ncbi:hypothetical protein CLF_109210 [Clonorchis sinensis]|uniref:C2H2-type domain-containing protein n=1 Tax=Clonorchis sinensis TaxID=79923 RepID=G7YSE1_CLOSI|nr:hypothetical protein CLF_109210 [Clonorchis sinensis]
MFRDLADHMSWRATPPIRFTSFPLLQCLIKETIEPFRSNHRQSSCASNHRERQLKTIKPKTSISPIREKLCTTQTSGPQNEASGNDTYMNSFKDFISRFNALGKQMSKEFLFNADASATLSSLGNDSVCPICNQSLGQGNREELIKHLAFVHLLPIPSILNYITATATGMQIGQEKTSLSRLPVLETPTPLECADRLNATREWYNSQTNISQSPPLIPEMGNSSQSRPTERVLKKDQTAEGRTRTGGYYQVTRAWTGAIEMERLGFKLRSSGQNNRTDKTSIRPPDEVPSKDTRCSMGPNLNCPQCCAGFSNLHQLQLHFLQEHAQTLESLFHLGNAFSAGRFPFSLPGPVLPPFYPQQYIPPKQDDFGPGHQGPNPLQNPCLLQPPIQHTTRSDLLRPDLTGLTALNPFGSPPSQMMNLQLTAAAHALGFPFSSVLIPDGVNSCVQDEKRPARRGDDKLLDCNPSRVINGGPIHTEPKRARMQTGVESTNPFTQVGMENQQISPLNAIVAMAVVFSSISRYTYAILSRKTAAPWEFPPFLTVNSQAMDSFYPAQKPHAHATSVPSRHTHPSVNCVYDACPDTVRVCGMHAFVHNIDTNLPVNLDVLPACEVDSR